MIESELFEVWAPGNSIWSPWVSPVLFAQVSCPEQTSEAGPSGPDLAWHEGTASTDSAVVVDLAGAESIRLGLLLAERGYRPVPLINASPGPLPPYSGSFPQSVVVLDMSSLIREICIGTQRLRSLTLASDAPPAFVLDANRLNGTKTLSDDLFDNRWMVFPQDFPSARFLAERKIKRVILVQAQRKEPCEDLAHILLRWQDAGIEILSKAIDGPGEPSSLTVSRPSRFRALWYRALAIMGLRRSSVGGFGAFIPDTFSAG